MVINSENSDSCRWHYLDAFLVYGYFIKLNLKYLNIYKNEPDSKIFTGMIWKEQVYGVPALMLELW